jgi:hypothetical protein
VGDRKELVPGAQHPNRLQYPNKFYHLKQSQSQKRCHTERQFAKNYSQEFRHPNKFQSKPSTEQAKWNQRLFLELHWWDLPRDDLISRQIYLSLDSCLLSIFISLMIQQSFRRFWHKNQRKEKHKQLQILLQEGNIFVHLLKVTMELMGKMKEKRRIDFHNEMDPLMVMVMMKVEE